MESALFCIITFDDNSSPVVSFLDYPYWLVNNLELILRDAVNVHTRKKLLGLWSMKTFKLACVTARKFADIDCCTALLSSIAFWMVKGQ